MLEAFFVDRQVHVRQTGNFTSTIKQVMQSLHQDHQWVPSTQCWVYPYSPGLIQALADVAEITRVRLVLDDPLQAQLVVLKKTFADEIKVRAQIQGCLDNRKLPLADYATLNDPPPWWHQKVAYHWAARVPSLYIALKPGCVGGDTIVKTMRHGLVHPVRIEDLYLKFNGLPAKHPWKKPGRTTVKSLTSEGFLRHNEIKQVIHQGVRAVIRVTLRSGKYIDCTPDHEIYVPSGRTAAGKLKVGDEVLTNGKPACRECGSTDNVVYYKYAKYRGLCRKCTKSGARHPNWKGGRQVDKDGHILISQQHQHPHCDRHGCVREHILVLEKKLGRYLTEDECGHHINGVKGDNRPENLELGTLSGHAFHHGTAGGFTHMDGGRAGTGGEIIFVPRVDKVARISALPDQDVYDLVMADPDRNFVANGIIIANCGKTRVGTDTIRGKFNVGHIRQPQYIELPARYSRAMGNRVLKQRWGIKGGVLITCPRPVIGEWVDQLWRFQSIRAVPIVGRDAATKRYKAGIPEWVHICSYESLESVEDNEYDGIIADEAHWIANADSNRTRRMLVLRESAAWALCLSGTPIPNQLESLWAQFFFLDGGRTLGPSFSYYKKRFLNQRGWLVDQTADAETRVSRAIARVTFFMDMQTAFPEKQGKIQQVIRVPLTKEQVDYYEAVRQHTITEIAAGSITAMIGMQRITKLLEICQGFVFDDRGATQRFSNAKLSALEDMITGQGDLTDRKVLVWVNFTPDMENVSAMLTKAKIKHMLFRGGMSDKQTAELRDKWNNDPEQQVLVGMIQIGLGVNLHAPTCVDAKGKPKRCSTTIFLGLSDKVSQVEQAMDRVYRGDQVETCLYRYILSDGLDVADSNGTPIVPVDVRMYQTLQAKLSQSLRLAEGTLEYARMLLGNL